MYVSKTPLLVALCAIAGCQALPEIDSLPRRLDEAAQVRGAIEFRTEGEELDAAPSVPGALSAADALHAALAHSPEIQAALAQVRQALSDARQTRLLPNPIVSLAIRFPESGGSPTVEAALAADLLSLVQRPGQAAAADNRVRAAAAAALTRVLDTAAEVSERYTAAQAVDAELAILAGRRAIVERLLTIARARLEGGEAARLDLLTLDSQRAELDLEIVEREAEQLDERLALARLMGQPSLKTDWQLTAWTRPAIVGTEAEWIACALRHRPEIQERQWELAALGDEATLARYPFLEGSGGLHAERDGGWTVGPAIDLPLPVFDWGQARRLKADAQVVESRHELTASRRRAVEEVRRAWAAVAAARRAIDKAESDLIPVQERRLAQAESQYRNGQADVTAVLLAQQDAQAGRARLIVLQKNLALASSRLARAAGGAGVAPLAPTTQPATTTTAPHDR